MDPDRIRVMDGEGASGEEVVVGEVVQGVIEEEEEVVVVVVVVVVAGM
jgi:hypothetical protein